MLDEKMRRVTRDRPCPICGKPDWCLLAEDGGAAICARISDGAVKRCGDAGWLHILDDRSRRPSRTLTSRVRADARGDFGRLACEYERRLTPDKLASVSQSLGISTESLKRLRIGWDGDAYTFPMRDSDGRVIGLRRRFPDGFKCAMRGSKSGLFVPVDLAGDRRLLVCEGTTDTAAALDLGFDAVGRPNCNSRIAMTARAARGRTEIVVVADADDVGERGAMKLADALVLHFSCVKVIVPPDGVKDLRAWLQGGLRSERLQGVIDGTSAMQITIR